MNRTTKKKKTLPNLPSNMQQVSLHIVPHYL
jgi:hypothetical protein